MKLYIAGPDVFRPDVAAWAEAVRERCRARGHLALIPLDGEAATAGDIFRSNLRLIAEADAVLANLTPFRGQEPDSGTCVEVGYALALGKPVVGYAPALPSLRERIGETDGQGWAVENFGLPFNLMLAVPLRLVAGGLDEALAALAAPGEKPL